MCRSAISAFGFGQGERLVLRLGVGGFHESGDGFAHIEWLLNVVHSVVSAATTHQFDRAGAKHPLPEALIEINGFNLKERNLGHFDIEDTVFLNEPVGGDGKGGFATNKISPCQKAQGTKSSKLYLGKH